MNKSIFKDFSKYVSFNILGQIAYSCYTLADTFFVSADIGTNGLTALNLAFPIFCIISGIGLIFHLVLSNPIQMKRNIGKILSNGIPPFLTEAASGIVMFLFNFIILRISGNVGVAALGIINVISLVVIALYTGLSQGIQPLNSQNHGAGKEKNVHTLLNYSLITSILLSIIIYGIIFFHAPFLVSVFNSEQNLLLVNYAVPGLKLYFTACPFIGFNIVLSTYFISINHPLPAQIISILRSFFILIPMAFTLSYFFGMKGIWLSYPATELLVFIIALTKRPRFLTTF